MNVERNLEYGGCGWTSSVSLAIVPRRLAHREVVVLKFGGTTAGSTPAEARIERACDTIAKLIQQGKSVLHNWG